MTDYDHWPPIKFRFFGDEDQAKGRIPQARSLMAQMIRRMEAQERNNGQWQVQAEDGTQFRVTKMGDVHVADIVGVSPAVERQRPMRDITPKPPEITQRELLMRPHGERFDSGNGDYLWVGARVLLPDFDPETHPYIETGASVQEVKKEFMASLFWQLTVPPEEWDEWEPYKINNSYEGMSRTTIQPAYDTESIRVPIKPIANVMMFEPGYPDQGLSSMVQSITAFKEDYGSRSTNTYLQTLQYSELSYTETVLSETPALKLGSQGYSLFTAQTIPGYFVVDGEGNAEPVLEQVDIAFNSGPGIYETPSFVGSASTQENQHWVYFNDAILWSENGSYTTGPNIYKFNNSMEAHGYVAVSLPKTKNGEVFSVSKEDLHPLAPTYAEPEESSDIKVSHVVIPDSYSVESESLVVTSAYTEVIADGRKFGMYNPFSFMLGGSETYVELTSGYVKDTYQGSIVWRSATGPSGYALYKERRGSQLITEADAIVGGSSPAELTANFMEGLYEVRLSVGWGSFPNTDFWQSNPVPVQVYIDMGGTIKTYEVECLMANYSADEGIFQASAWENDQEPTLFDDKWYPGCWLIDIKNQTIIHETDPGKLDRPWFTTE